MGGIYDCKDEPGQVYVVMQISMTDGEACCLGVYSGREKALEFGNSRMRELRSEKKWQYGITVFPVRLDKEYTFMEIYGTDLPGLPVGISV